MEKKYVFVCEVCDKRKKITSKEAFSLGWDYPPFIGQWRVVSPRTCGSFSCSITQTLWWALAVEKLGEDELSEKQLDTLNRILHEPDKSSNTHIN